MSNPSHRRTRTIRILNWAWVWSPLLLLHKKSMCFKPTKRWRVFVCHATWRWLKGRERKIIIWKQNQFQGMLVSSSSWLEERNRGNICIWIFLNPLNINFFNACCPRNVEIEKPFLLTCREHVRTLKKCLSMDEKTPLTSFHRLPSHHLTHTGLHKPCKCWPMVPHQVVEVANPTNSSSSSPFSSVEQHYYWRKNHFHLKKDPHHP